MTKLLERMRAGFKGWRDLIEDRPLLVSVSGGKDSTAMALWLIDQGLQDRCYWVFADTKWEHPDLYEYLEYLETKIGPIHRAVSQKYPGGMKDMVREKGFFPNGRWRFCTDYLKVKPIKEYAAHLTEQLGEEPISVVGVRAEESRSRASLDEFDSGGPIGLDTWRPIISWGVEDVVAKHSEHGIAPVSMYLRDKHPMGRVGCYPCIMAVKNDIRSVAEHDQWRIDEIRELEADARRVYIERNPDWKEKGFTLPTFFQSKMTDKDGNPVTTPIDAVVEWSQTSRGGVQFQLIETGQPGCRMWGLCDMGPEKRDAE